MEPSLYVPFILLAALLLLRMPVAFAMALSGFVGLAWIIGFDGALGVLTTQPYRHATSLLLTTVPMFILMAEFLSHSSIVGDLFKSASHWMGRFRGGLAMSAVLANTGFAALSGSSTAAAASIGKIAVPQMRQAGYDDRLSVGTVAAAGTFASTIPPSVGLIIYGVQTETTISGLFMAGILPGIVTAVLYVVGIYVWARLRPDAAGRLVHSTWSERLRSLRSVWPAIVLIVALITSIYMGIVTPTEAGALGAFLGLIISVSMGGLRWRGFVDSVVGSVRATAMILMIIIGAGIFGTFISASRAAYTLFDLIQQAGLPSLVVMAIIVVIYLVLGTFMDAIAMMILTLPLTFPLAMELGYSPIWFGILVIKCAEIGLITPPLGLNVFVASAATGADLGKAFAGSARFVAIELCMVVVLFLVPSIATYLPETM